MKNKKYIHFIPGLIVILFFLIIYLVKGVYPFGQKTVLQGDLNLYTDNIVFVLNILKNHEFGKIVFTNLIFAGNSNFGVISWFTPFFIIYMFCFNTSRIIYFMSYVIIIKSILCMYSSYFLFNKLFGKENYKLNILASILYTFSAYAIINYSTLRWIDILIIFPLLIFSLKRLIEQNKFALYSLLLAMCIVIEYQITYMIVFSIIATGLLAIKILKIENKKKVILSLGIGTVLGILISGVYFYPAIKVYLNSTRLNANDIIINSSFWSTKIAYILLSSILLFGTINACKHIKEDKNVLFLFLAILITGIIPILFEGVNIIWHGGQYDAFPFRYAFIPLFYMDLISIYYFKKYLEKDFLESERKKSYTLSIDIIVCIISLASISVINSLSNPIFQIIPITLIFIVVYNVFAYNLYIKIFRSFSKEKVYDIILIIVLLEIGILSCGFIGLNLKTLGYEHSEQTSKNGIIIKDTFQQINSHRLYRYKDPDNILLETSGMAIDMPTIESWVTAPDNQSYVHDKLGYSRLVGRLRSTGGTVLSDQIVGNRYALAQNILNSEIYNYIGSTTNGIKLYELKNYLPFGIVYDSTNDIRQIPESLDMFDTQNWIYKNLFDKKDKDEILRKLEINKDYERRFNSIFVEENSKLNYEKDPEGKMASNWYVEYDIKIPEKSILYMLYDDSVKNIYNIFSIEQIEKVKMNNDEDQILFDILSIESFEDINMEKYNVKRIKSYYPSPFDDSIVELGIFENEVITIRLSFAYISNDVDVSSIKFGLLDFEKYKELGYNIPDTKAYCDQNKVSIEVNSPDSNKSLFLPLVYDESIIVKNNGKQVKAEQALNALISIPLEKGENRIEITYKNPNMIIGLIITIVGIMILTVFVVFREQILNMVILQNIAYILFIIVTIAFYLYVYGYGIISTFIS